MADDNKVLIEELEKRLIWYREEASDAEFDADAVDAICTMLQKLSPAQEAHRTKEEAYRNILEQIRAEEESGGAVGGSGIIDGRGAETEADKNGKIEKSEDAIVGEQSDRSIGKRRSLFGKIGKKGLRAVAVAAVVIGVFASLNMVAYAKNDKSLFTMFLERVGWLKIVKEPETEEAEINITEKAEEFYNSWADLNPEVKEKLTVPAYIPEGYSLFGIRCWNTRKRKIIQADYYNQQNGHILFEITLWGNDEYKYRENLPDEDIYVLLSEYSDENTLYYEYEDEYICMEFMENSFYRIHGNIELEEILKIGKGLEDI